MSDNYDPKRLDEIVGPDGGWNPPPPPARVDITGGVLAVHPAAVVTQSRTEAGWFYEVRVNQSRPVRLMVEYGDDEAQALAVILERIADARMK